MPRRLLALVGLAMSWVATAPPEGRAQDLVVLQRWEAKAALVPNPGPGTEYYRLIAEAKWDASAPRDSSLYELRVTLPDGRVESRRLPVNQGVGARRIGVLVPKESVRNLLPSHVRVQAEIVYRPTDSPLGPPLLATIDDFPTPSPRSVDRRPYGWGRPLQPEEGGAARLPGDGPDGFHFVRVFGKDGRPGFFLADTEASNDQVTLRLGDRYDPAAGRTDDFSLSGLKQPAFNLTPKTARAYLDTLSWADARWITYRLPTREEWLTAARAGNDGKFWWDGESPPAGAVNFLGDEGEILQGDTTAEVLPLPIDPNFRANPFGLFHTFGNVAEWATTDDPDVFARLGGHFRSDPKAENFAKEIFETTVTGEDTLGEATDPGRPFVGVRPAFDLTAERGAEIVESVLGEEPALAEVRATFDPDRAVAVISGTAADERARRIADERLRGVWFLAAVDNKLIVPTPPPGQLATLGEVVGPAPRVAPLTRWTDLVTVSVNWAAELPVSGSEYFVNAFLPDGQVVATILPELRPGPDGRSTFPLPLHRLRAAGVAEGGPVTVALSLGAPAQSQTDPRIVSNLEWVRWTPANPVPAAGPGPERPRPIDDQGPTDE